MRPLSVSETRFDQNRDLSKDGDVIRRNLISGISEHFPRRRTEWALAVMQVGLGAIGLVTVLRPSELLSIWLWGAGCLVVGVSRLVALVINGSFAGSWYGRWSHHARGVLAVVSCFFWTTIVINACNAGVSSFTVFIYLGLLFLEVLNVREAWQDAGEADRGVMDASL